MTPEEIEDVRIKLRQWFAHAKIDMQPYAALRSDPYVHWANMISAVGEGRDQKAVYDDAKALPIVQKASRSVSAAEALQQFAREFIERGEPLPPVLGQYVLDAMKTGQPKRKRNQKRANASRDVMITCAVQIAVDLGLQATANDRFQDELAEDESNFRESACRIVSDELLNVGIECSAKRVAEIWAKHAHMRRSEPDPAASA